MIGGEQSGDRRQRAESGRQRHGAGRAQPPAPGRGGRQFTLGEVRAELGIKSRDKREQKRFRSRFRECGQMLGENLEKIGPNTFRLKAGFAPDQTPQPLDLAIKHLAIDSGHIGFDDRLMSQHAALGLKDLSVTLDNFLTLAKTPARYTLKTAFEHGGALDTSGGFTLASKNADAKLALSDLALPPLQPYVANAVAASIADGTLSASLPPHVDWSKPAPSSSITTATQAPRRASETLTCFASACLTMFVSPSCTTR